MPDETVRSALKRHAAQVDQVVQRFLADVDAVIARAQATLQNQLLGKLKLDADHKVLRTAANQRILRRLPQLWCQALADSGLDSVIERYLSTFPSQIPAFKDVLAAINHEAADAFPIPYFTQADYAYFSHLQLTAGNDIRTLLTTAANAAVTRTAYSVGAISFADLTARIMKSTAASVGRAETMANTSLQMFYRSVSGAGYDQIQAKVKQPLRYKYLNPRDKVTREFCLNLLNRNQSYTRAEIDKMDNGQGLDVWTSGGGYNCRGSFILQPLQQVDSH